MPTSLPADGPSPLDWIAVGVAILTTLIMAIAIACWTLRELVSRKPVPGRSSPADGGSPSIPDDAQS